LLLRLYRPMIERGRGGVLTVSSGFGLVFFPAFAAYVGTKHYVTSLTESLRCEAAGTGVVVTQLCPGPVATEVLHQPANPHPPRRERGDLVHDLARAVRALGVERVPARAGARRPDVVDDAVRGPRPGVPAVGPAARVRRGRPRDPPSRCACCRLAWPAQEPQ